MRPNDKLLITEVFANFYSTVKWEIFVVGMIKTNQKASSDALKSSSGK